MPVEQRDEARSPLRWIVTSVAIVAGTAALATIVGAIEHPLDPEPDVPTRQISREAPPGPSASKALIRTATLARNQDSLPELSDSAVADPDPQNRRQAVRALWLAAADGLDTDGELRARLEEGARDRDPHVVAMAERALADLEALEAREQASEAVPAPVQVGSTPPWTHAASDGGS